MIKVDGNWTGTISGTNNGNVFVEMNQTLNNLNGTVRICDHIQGTAVYTFNGEVNNNDIILKMTPDKKFFSEPITQEITINNQRFNIKSPADSGHGIVTVHAKYIESGMIEGKWTSTIGTGGKMSLRMEDLVNKDSDKSKGDKKSIFISYCHVDELHLERLKIHLKPLERDGLVDLWDDSKIKAGAEWKKEINDALAKAAIAILIVSADFLASDFIVNNELPPLLAKAEKEGTWILPVILKPCRFSRDKNLSKFQAINSPQKALLSGNEIYQEEIWDRLASQIEERINL